MDTNQTFHSKNVLVAVREGTYDKLGPDGMLTLWSMNDIFDCVDIETQRFVFDSAMKQHIRNKGDRSVKKTLYILAKSASLGIVKKVGGNVYELNNSLFVVTVGQNIDDDFVQRKFAEGDRKWGE